MKKSEYIRQSKKQNKKHSKRGKQTRKTVSSQNLHVLGTNKPEGENGVKVRGVKVKKR